MNFDFNQLCELSRLDGGRFKSADYNAALKFCRTMASGHYENFPVASVLIPKEQRRHIAAVYAFARTADDIADEYIDISTDKRLEILNQFAKNYKSAENTTNPIFLAVRRSIQELSLPFEPFDRLLEAFRRDIIFKQADTFDDLIDYCTFSANPVGELVLRIFNNYDDITSTLSDNICTALQLTNFWQDLSRDIKKNRLFIPKDRLKKYKLSSDDILAAKASGEFDACILELINDTEELFNSGKDLIKHINNFRLRIELKATIIGGMTILKRCKENRNNLLTFRTKLNKSDLFGILAKSILSIK